MVFGIIGENCSKNAWKSSRIGFPYAGEKALVIVDIQNDITKHYRDIIENINSAIDWAVKSRILPFIWG